MLRVNHLKRNFSRTTGLFRSRAQLVAAVDDVSLYIREGETLGLVGESGCGKSTLGKSMLRLIEPSEGTLEFDGLDYTRLDPHQMRILRRKMQIIFQDPYASLNPHFCTEDIIGEALQIHNLFPKKSERKERVLQLLSLVGLREESLHKYPHEFSGGQRQRIGIARALAVEPRFIVCDEPVSALDVSIQAQIVNLLQDLQDQLGLTYLFIAHDLMVVKHISTRVAVMYLGNIVEISDSEELFAHPKHPYTQALLSAVPAIERSKSQTQIALKGEVPSAMNAPSGCKFHPRCPKAMGICSSIRPQLVPIGRSSEVACHLYG